MRGCGGGAEEEGVGALGLVAAFAVGVEESRGRGRRAEGVRGWLVVDCYDTRADVQGEVPDFEAKLGIELWEKVE